MKTFFLKSVIMLNFLACFFNSITLIAGHTVYHKVTIPKQEAPLSAQDESCDSKDSKKEEGKNSSDSKSHRHRPRMYRVVSGCLLFVGVATLVSSFWVLAQILPFAVMSAAPFLALVLIFPLSACIVGYQNLE